MTFNYDDQPTSQIYINGNWSTNGLTLQVGGNNSNVGNVMLNGNGSGGGSLTFVGPGTLTLPQENYYTGGTTVNGGTIYCTSSNTYYGAMGNGNITVNNGGTIVADNWNSLDGYGNQNSTPTGTIYINSGGTIALSGGGTQNLNPLVMNGGTLSADTPLASWANWNFNYGVSTSGYGTTSYITGGNVALTQPGGTVFNIGNNDILNLSSEIDHTINAADTGLIKTGPGCLVLTGNNTYTSGTTINGGCVQINQDAALGAVPGNPAVNVTLNNNGVLMNYNSSPTLNANRTISLGSGGGALDAGWTQNFTINAQVTGSGDLTINGDNGTVILNNAANNYTGGTTVLGTVQANANTAMGPGYVWVASGGHAILGADSMTVANNFTLNGFSTGGSIISGNLASGNVTTLNGSIILNGGGTVASWWNDKTFTLAGQITGSGGLTFDLASTLGTSVGGRFLVTGTNNNYTGNTTVNGSSTSYNGYTGQAMLYLSTDNALPTTTSLTLNYANLYLNGYNQTLAAIPGTNTAYIGNGSTTPASLTVGYGNASSTFGGVIADNGISVTNTSSSPATVYGTVSLTKIGSGILTLTGNNTYSGGTTVNGGMLWINSDASLGAVPSNPTVNLTINNGAVLMNDNSAPTLNANRTISLGSGGGAIEAGWSQNFTINGQMTGSGGLTVEQDSGIVILNGQNTFTGGTTMAGGNLYLGGSSGTALGTGDLTMTQGDNGYVNGVYLTTNQTMGVIHFTSTATTLNDCHVRPNGNNLTCAGLDSDTADLSNVIENGGYGANQNNNGTLTIDVASGNTWTYNGIIRDADYEGGSGKLSVVINGPGTQVLSGGNIYTGGTTVNGGTLALSGSGSIATSPTITVGAGAYFDVSAVDFALASGQTLRGTGTVKGNLSAPTGTVSPGNGSPGTLTATGSYTQSGTGTFLTQLASASSFSVLAVTGQATLGGTIDVDTLSGYSPAVGTNFQVLTAGGGITNANLNGVAFNTSGAPLASGDHWYESIVSIGGGAEAIDLDVVSNVIPASISLSTSTSSAGIITGGSTTLGATVGNTAATGSASLNSTLSAAVTAGSATLGAVTPATGTIAPGTNQASTVSATSTNIGVNTITFTATDINANNSPQTADVNLTVLAHASPTVGSAVNLGTVIVGAAAPTGTSTFGNNSIAGGYRANAQVTSLSGLNSQVGISGISVGNQIAQGGQQTINFTGSTSQVGNFNSTLTIGSSDEQDLAGWTSEANQTIAVDYTVLDHSQASFASATAATTQTLDFGSVLQNGNAGTQSFSIYNMSEALRAPLRLPAAIPAARPQ